MFLSKAKGRSLVGWGLRPYEYPGATSTSLECALRRSCARPTGGTHGRTTAPPILLISIRFPLKNKEGGVPHGGVVGELRPYERSRCVEHDGEPQGYQPVLFHGGAPWCCTRAPVKSC